ncbi:MAG: polymer-forming cytoskeletal protein [Lewinellaceae bacterium]|nr:polymer-forming cytoskeletal protein [Saprospiraceae bacterium]MCB0544742.1 polymer-forming cytoskeletal protein [Saprospiraceae bacterium]MCB9305113.1 polymer-forming cytoskeletal protein [Lewinellaceae bacterium]
MFGSNKNTDEVKTTPSAPSNALNALAKGTVVEGSIRCDSDLRVDGTIKGKLNCQAKVIIGPTGAVEGEIKCQNAVIEGRFKGNLHVSELLNVRETAEVDGEISTNKLLVQSGARFNVSCKMEVGAANGAVKNFDTKTTSTDAATTAGKVTGGKEEVRN